MVAAAHSESDGRPPGNGGRLFEGGWGWRTVARLMGHGPATPSKGAVTDPPSATANGADAGLPPAKPAIEVTTDFGVELATSAGSCQAHPSADGATGAPPATTANGVAANPVGAKPAIEVTTDFGIVPAESPTSVPPASASACAVHGSFRRCEGGSPEGRAGDVEVLLRERTVHFRRSLQDRPYGRRAARSSAQ
jgi:hypothetical protein